MTIFGQYTVACSTSRAVLRSFSYTRSNSYDTNRVLGYNGLNRRLRDYEYYPSIREPPEPLKHYRCKSGSTNVSVIFFSVAVPMPPVETIDTELKLSKVENHRLQTELDAMQYRFQKLDSRKFSFPS
jgi:hypothetical protein